MFWPCGSEGVLWTLMGGKWVAGWLCTVEWCRVVGFVAHRAPLVGLKTILSRALWCSLHFSTLLALCFWLCVLTCSAPSFFRPFSLAETFRNAFAVRTAAVCVRVVRWRQRFWSLILVRAWVWVSLMLREMLMLWDFGFCRSLFDKTQRNSTRRDASGAPPGQAQ